jgi:hypothetical protein
MQPDGLPSRISLGHAVAMRVSAFFTNSRDMVDREGRYNSRRAYDSIALNAAHGCPLEPRIHDKIS